MTSVLNLDALGAAHMRLDPYPHAPYENTFTDVDRLLKSFPEDGYEYHSQRRLLEALGKKGSPEWYQHNVRTRPLLDLGETTPHDAASLDECWIALAEDITSADYREALSDLVNFDLRPYQSQTHFWSFEGGASFKPHVDKPHKLVTHLMYLTEKWDPSVGGIFQVLGSEDTNDLIAEYPPHANHSLVLRRTDNAWHSVTNIPQDGRPRRLIQTWFWVS